MIDHRYGAWGGPADPPCLLESMARVAAAHPDDPAVVAEDATLTYRELTGWAATVAGQLAGLGVGAGDRVAVTGPRCAATVAAFVATVALGATWVPLDPEYPRKRLEFMLADSAAAVLLYTGEDRPGLDADAHPVAAPAPGAALPAPGCDPDRPVYVIYTSGSTGWPKGVAVGHRCLDNMAEWQVHHSPATRLRTGQFAPLNFDVWFQEVLGSLCGGGTVIVVPERLRRDPVALLAWLREHAVERLFLPYVALQMLAVAAELAPALDDVALVEVNTAGEQLVCTPQIRRLFDRLPRARLVNHYGQSESAMVSAWVLPGPSASWPALPPIGTPLPGCELLVDAPDPAEPDTGELLVAGLPVSLGYLGRPELNAERYPAVGPTPHGHTRVFRTGDLVRIADGVVTFLTRADDEVKVRGVRVNLREIDAWLLDRPGVTAAAAVLVRRGPSPQLRAVVSVREPAGFDESAVLADLAEVLPEASVPRSITVVDGLPRTPSGKIDRDAVAELV